MPLTILWIVAIMNMVNFLDGLDGLAAGVCAISGVTFCVIALSLGKPDAAILSAIVAGACIGFLRHNFYPARIFMGDSGALLLGFILAAVSIQGLLKTAATVALFFPLLVLAVPILDTSFVVARRLKHGEKVYAPDQAHLHHRFLRRGLHAAARGVDDVRLVRDARRGRARDALHPVPRGRRLAPVGDGRGRRDRRSSRSAFSLYVVYLLEIVKLANPRLRRRGAGGTRSARPPSAGHARSLYKVRGNPVEKRI